MERWTVQKTDKGRKCIERRAKLGREYKKLKESRNDSISIPFW